MDARQLSLAIWSSVWHMHLRHAPGVISTHQKACLGYADDVDDLMCSHDLGYAALQQQWRFCAVGSSGVISGLIGVNSSM